MAEPIRAGVIGWPIAHSRSPLIHGYWLHHYAIAGSYEAVAVEPEGVAAFLANLATASWAGCNVTLPDKEAACAAVARRTAAAEVIGAVNTVWLEDSQLCGDNTDSYGFATNLDDNASGWDDGDRAAVIGAGGAARAVVHALLGRGFGRIDVVNRTPARATELAERFGAKLRAWPWDKMAQALAGADFVVNTTSLGMEGQGELRIDLAPVSDHALATDIVYVPLETPFLSLARERGLACADGLGMLLHQAVPGFERWFGRRPQVTPALRNIVVADLDRPS